MAILNHKARKFKTQSPRVKPSEVVNADRCPGCLGYPDNIRAFAFYMHKATGRMFGYTLCEKCTVQLGINPKVIVANVESYFAEEIAKMDAEAKAVAK